MRFIKLSDENIETYLDTRTNHKFVKNKRGQLFLVNINSILAEQQKRKVIYTTLNGKTVVVANSFERNSVKRVQQREWERRQLMWYHFLQMIKKEFQCQLNQQVPNEKNGNPWQNLEINICLSAPLKDVEDV